MYYELKKHIDKNHNVTLFSEIENDEEVYRGYIVGLTRNLVCLWLTVEWQHDGFLVVPVKYVTRIEYGKVEKTRHRILKSEGCLTDVVKPGWLNIGSYKSVFTALETNCNNVIVESRLLDKDIFVIGKIDKIKDKEVFLTTFDTEGKWEDAENKISFKDITVVKFGDHYSSVFRKYVT